MAVLRSGGQTSACQTNTSTVFTPHRLKREEKSLVFEGWSTQPKWPRHPATRHRPNSSYSSTHRATTACCFDLKIKRFVNDLSLSHDQLARTDGPVIDSGSTAGLSGCTPSPAVGLIARCIACFPARRQHTYRPRVKKHRSIEPKQERI